MKIKFLSSRWLIKLHFCKAWSKASLDLKVRAKNPSSALQSKFFVRPSSFSIRTMASPSGACKVMLARSSWPFSTRCQCRAELGNVRDCSPPLFPYTSWTCVAGSRAEKLALARRWIPCRPSKSPRFMGSKVTGPSSAGLGRQWPERLKTYAATRGTQKKKRIGATDNQAKT